MIKRCILAVGLALPMAAVCNTVQANPSTNDMNHWLDEIAYIGAESSADVKPLRDVQPNGGEDSEACTYQGGPKSPLWACR
jgi:hypothetical protein